MVAELGLHRADDLAERRGVRRLLELADERCRARGIRAAHPVRLIRVGGVGRGEIGERRAGLELAQQLLRGCLILDEDVRDLLSRTSHADNASLFAS